MNRHFKSYLASASLRAALVCTAALACASASAEEVAISPSQLENFKKWVDERDHRIWQEKHREQFNIFVDGLIASSVNSQAFFDEIQPTGEFVHEIVMLLKEDMSPANWAAWEERYNATIKGTPRRGTLMTYRAALKNRLELELEHMQDSFSDADGERAALCCALSIMPLNGFSPSKARNALGEFIRGLDSSDPNPSAGWWRQGRFGAYANRKFPLPGGTHPSSSGFSQGLPQENPQAGVQAETQDAAGTAATQFQALAAQLEIYYPVMEQMSPEVQRALLLNTSPLQQAAATLSYALLADMQPANRKALRPSIESIVLGTADNDEVMDSTYGKWSERQDADGKRGAEALTLLINAFMLDFDKSDFEMELGIDWNAAESEGATWHRTGNFARILKAMGFQAP